MFKAGQPYHLYVDLDLPDAPVNRDAGVFMVELALCSRPDLSACMRALQWPGTQLPDASPHHVALARPVHVQYRSWAVRQARKALLLAWYVLGVWDESVHVRVPLMLDLVDTDPPLQYACLRLSDPRVLVYQATLSAEAHMTGVVYVCHVCVCWRCG